MKRNGDAISPRKAGMHNTPVMETGDPTPQPPVRDEGAAGSGPSREGGDSEGGVPSPPGSTGPPGAAPPPSWPPTWPPPAQHPPAGWGPPPAGPPPPWPPTGPSPPAWPGAPGWGPPAPPTWPPPAWGAPRNTATYPGWNPARGAAPQIGYGRFRARGVTELIDAAFTLYRRNFPLIVAVVALAYVPYALVRFVAYRVAGVPSLDSTLSSIITSPRHVATVDNRTAVQAALVLVSVIEAMLVRPIALGAVSAAAGARYVDRTTTLESSYRVALRRLGGLLLVGLAVAVVYTPSYIAQVSVDTSLPANATSEQASAVLGNETLLLLLVAAAFAASIPLALAIPAVVAEGVGGLRGIVRSWRLVRGAYWRTLGIVVLLDIIVGIIGLVIAAVLSLPGTALHGDAQLAVDTAAQAVALVLATPIALITIVLLYYDRRIRREAFDIEMLAATL